MSTSKLQIQVGNFLDKSFPSYKIRENYRPDWLVSSNYSILELDFFIEEINTAFEIQGDQHFMYIKHFHKTYADFERQKMYDEEKKYLCEGRNIKLYEICTFMDAEIIINNILVKHGKVFPKVVSPRFGGNKQIKEEIKKDIEKRRSIVFKSKNRKALFEIDKWEIKTCVMGKSCKWDVIDIPLEIAEDIKRGKLSFNEARVKLY